MDGRARWAEMSRSPGGSAAGTAGRVRPGNSLAQPRPRQRPGKSSISKGVVRNGPPLVHFFRRLLKQPCQAPRRLATDTLRSYAPAHREVMPNTIHDTSQYANNRAELSHEPTRQHERTMRRFKSMGQAQRLLEVHGTMKTCLQSRDIDCVQKTIGYSEPKHSICTSR